MSPSSSTGRIENSICLTRLWVKSILHSALIESRVWHYRVNLDLKSVSLFNLLRCCALKPYTTFGARVLGFRSSARDTRDRSIFDQFSIFRHDHSVSFLSYTFRSSFFISIFLINLVERELSFQLEINSIKYEYIF